MSVGFWLVLPADATVWQRRAGRLSGAFLPSSAPNLKRQESAVIHVPVRYSVERDSRYRTIVVATARLGAEHRRCVDQALLSSLRLELQHLAAVEVPCQHDLQTLLNGTW